MLVNSQEAKAIRLQKKLHYIAGSLRSRQTLAEQKLWECLRRRQLSGLRFLRQHPIHSFIADFYCHEHKLLIEVDGSIHDYQKVKDENRDRVLGLYDYITLRFTNEEVLNNSENVIRTILRYCSPPMEREEMP